MSENLTKLIFVFLLGLLKFQFALSNDLQRADEYFKTSERQINLSRKHWSFQLWCRLEKTLANGFLVNVTATWEKLNPRLMIEPSEHFSVETSVFVNETSGRQFLFSNLTIKHTNLKHSGYYNCHFSQRSGSRLGWHVERSFNIFGSPIVKNVPSDNGTYTLPSIDATEGESIELHCPIVGAPQPEMSWWKDGELISIGESLTLANLTMEDRDVYECRGTNEYGVAIASQLVRVKSHLRALWPSLGILGVLLSMALIIIVDKKHPSKLD